ncbi:MAG: tRNA lysidine(34) synthetase [Desulfovibrio sp.]|uniref:tRNA lysidine(34) synthetase n=1 Tax=Desulfovibrio sp. 7SRBS1 TaxID=3378064 RepID=UPI003B3E4F7C
MQQTEHIHPHARIGVAVSGGMDSFVLLQVLRYRQRIVPFPFEIMALHINPGFAPDNHAPLVKWAGDNGIALHCEKSTMGPDAHSSKNHKNSPCFYCSWFRRKRLFDLCRQYKLTHLAIGHNKDDLISTFFMNLINTGKVEGMAGKASYFGGSLHLIRPLLLVEKQFIRKAAKAWALPIWQNPCPSSETSSRKQTLIWLRESLGKDPKKLQNVANAISRWQLDLDLDLP